MWIILNPAKAHRFTTKGINLHKNAPTALVPPDLELEFMTCIKTAISDGTLIRVDSNSLDGLSIAKQASLGTITDDEVKNKSAQLTWDQNEEGQWVSTLSMPDADGEASPDPTKPRQSIIMTGITELPLDEDDL